MTNKDLLKIFCVVVVAEAICHKPIKKNGILSKVIHKLDEKGVLKDNERSQRLKAVINNG